MCGIVGFQGRFSEDLLSRMTAAVSHRGPDGQGAVVLTLEGQPITGLGHRRLAIIDLSEAGHQPMTVRPDAGGGMRAGLTLVYNGEIYNHRELREELEADGHVFQSHSDSEALLHLYERDGLEMLSRLNGIFAFAIHDARRDGRPSGVERGALFVARDQIGVKPFYYAQTNRGVLFGSEIKALLCDDALSREVDPIAVHQMLAYLWTPAPSTMLASVRKLPPGFAAVISGGQVVRQWCHYDIPYTGTRGHASRAETAEALRGHLATAVRRQLVSDVPVGAYLSGGLDSSAIVAMMVREQPDARPTCFTIGFDAHADADGIPEDLPYARRVAAHLGVNLVEVPMAPSAILRLPEMIAMLDEPQADPAPIAALMIAERAREMGIPVLLSGAGGDDLFSGYRRHAALLFDEAWSKVPSPLRRGSRVLADRVAARAGTGRGGVLARRVAKLLAHTHETGDRRVASYFLWSTEALRRGLYAPAFASQMRDVDTLDPLLQSLARIPDETEPLQRMLYLEMKHFLADHNLNYTDRAGMAAGVEVRVPLVDLDLVRFATSVPSRFKQRGRTGKAIFKEAMEPFLPRDVVYRPKAGFGAPLKRWLNFELRDLVTDTLAPDVIARRGFFDSQSVTRLLADERTGRIDAAYTVFALMCFELWCKRFLDMSDSSTVCNRLEAIETIRCG